MPTYESYHFFPSGKYFVWPDVKKELFLALAGI